MAKRPPIRKLTCPEHGETKMRTREKPRFCPVCGKKVALEPMGGER